MPSFLQIENISKSYGTKVLFDRIGFNINEGDKIALVAPNGAGKTTLMRILAGKEKSDSGGKITFLKDIRVAFLEQEFDYDPSRSVLEQVEASSQGFMSSLVPEQLHDYELRIRRHLSELGFRNPEQKMSELSGGEVKRVALVVLLSSDAEFLIMDEPTNHLDFDAIEYLEDKLQASRRTVFMVTHDRYFLERVCNTIMELDQGHLYTYRGDYENFIEKRDDRIENWNSNLERIRNTYLRELAWIRSSPCARTGKAKYRKDAFKVIQEKAGQTRTEARLSLEGVGEFHRLGQKIFDCNGLGFSYGDNVMLKDFTYNFARGERVGIVGRNGIGKSTFVRLLAGDDLGGTMTGSLERGESVDVGYYRQSGMEFGEDQTVMKTVTDSALLSQFMFPHEMYSTRVGDLSGGERRRLYLLTILQKQPNVLILDEPTNDLDIVTLNVLEDYLLDFRGTLIIISHDRHFLDRLVDHLFVFSGGGNVKDFVGNYTEYRSWLADKENEDRKASRVAASTSAAPRRHQESGKLSYKERREYEALGEEIERLEAEKSDLEAKLSSGELPYDEIASASVRFEEVSAQLDEKGLRWLELADRA